MLSGFECLVAQCYSDSGCGCGNDSGIGLLGSGRYLQILAHWVVLLLGGIIFHCDTQY